ncbi:MAG: sigma-54 dependent transcriptional regulator [Desulfobacula sp.]|nr:sigma-54 dependent transcriptional regulator [Desulfobacula sp.]
MIRLKRTKEHLTTTGSFLLNSKGQSDHENQYRGKYIELMEALFPVVNNSDIFTRIVMISNNLFSAERGALFWFKNGEFTNDPELKTGVKLTKEEISSEQFKLNFNLVLKAFKKKHIVIDTWEHNVRYMNKKEPKFPAVSLPLMIKGKFKAVLYHDHFHSKSGFDFFIGNNSFAGRLARHLSSYVEYGLNYNQSKTTPKNGKTGNSQKPILENQSILYQSKVMGNLIDEVDKAARSATSVLVLGETGVGKELIARRTHSNSHRRNNPFVTINAATIPEGLFESELFGHEKGAFTGAEFRKKGLIEVADGGTLFIDEVGEMPLHMQAKLLRAIQEKAFYRVGGTKVIHSDFRLVTATNSDLQLEACEGRFREDLYYRLNLFSFTIPPLRERGDDVVLIAKRLLEHYSGKYCKEGLSLTPLIKKRLMSYPWPGNVRELKNVMEKSVIMAFSGGPFEVNIPLNNSKVGFRSPFADEPTLDEVNRRYILYVLNKTNGKISGPGGAAELMDIGRTTLTARMRRLGIK